MKYSRKKILKKAFSTTAFLFAPSTPLMVHLFNTIHLPQSELMFKLMRSDIPDVIIMDNSSQESFDFVSLKYDRETDNAPCIGFSGSQRSKPYTEDEYKSTLRLLMSYANKNNVELFINGELVKSLKECGEGNEISDDLYRPVSSVYAELYQRRDNVCS